MSIKEDVREFLTTRRARVTPQQAGLPTYGDKRRVPGLRREEVALLAGVSVDYYVRLERGNLAGVSEQVLDALARALQLDDAEQQHLFDLARAASGPARGARPTAASRVRPGVLRLLESFQTPAYVRNRRFDVLAANDAAVALYDGILDRLPMNLARFLFLDPKAPEFFAEWSKICDDAVAMLRAEAGRRPFDKNLTGLVGELGTRSEEFRGRWARHNVKHHRTTPKRLRTRVAGEIELTGEALDLAGDELLIITYTAEPDSPAAAALRFLASWTAGQDRGDRPLSVRGGR